MNKETVHLLEKDADKSILPKIERFDALIRQNGVSDQLENVARRFAQKHEVPVREALAEARNVCAGSGISEHSVDLLLTVRSLPYLHKQYRDKGISDEVFYDTMDDIRYKIKECIECKGVVGIFVAWWYDGFFDMTRFAYGRFQYEPYVYNGEDIRFSDGKTLCRGATFINFHIPSSGIPLTDDVRLSSYRAAYPHYAPLFEDGIVIFGCDSWLLYPGHREFLPPHSNILRFMDDFEVINGKENEVFSAKWRVFGRYADRPASELPRDTSLRAAYADRLASGKPTGAGFGAFKFDGEKIIK